MSLVKQDLLKTLISVVEQAEDSLRERTLQRIDSERDRRIFAWVMEQYQDKSRRRWYDPYHILYSTSFALDLVEAGLADPLVVPGVLLHDIGYFSIGGSLAWNSPQARIIHMQEGAALAARVLAENDFTPDEIEKTVGMIAVHDNPYLGYPLEGEDRLALRDCDRVWVMHLGSFYKDWIGKQENDPNSDCKTLLAARRVHFFGPEEAVAEAKWGVTEEIAATASSRVERPHLEKTRQRVRRLFDRRLQELDKEERGEEGLFSSSKRFGEYLRSAILEE